MRRLIPLLALFAVLAAACGGSDEATPTTATTAATTTTVASGGRVAAGDPVTVAEAIAGPTDRPQRVTGYVFVSADGSMVIADSILESFPPQPGGASLVVVGFSLEGMTGIAQGPADGAITAWSEAPIEVLGTVADGVLTFFDMPNV